MNPVSAFDYLLSVHDAKFSLLLVTKEHCWSASPWWPSPCHAHLIPTCDFVWRWSCQGRTDCSRQGFFSRSSEDRKMAILLLDYFVLSPLSILLPSALPSTFAFGFPLATFPPNNADTPLNRPAWKPRLWRWKCRLPTSRRRRLKSRINWSQYLVQYIHTDILLCMFISLPHH